MDIGVKLKLKGTSSLFACDLMVSAPVLFYCKSSRRDDVDGPVSRPFLDGLSLHSLFPVQTGRQCIHGFQYEACELGIAHLPLLV